VTIVAASAGRFACAWPAVHLPFTSAAEAVHRVSLAFSAVSTTKETEA
jgi:hypothetical protein